MPSPTFQRSTEAAIVQPAIQRASVNGVREQGASVVAPMDGPASIVLPWPPSILSGHANGNRRWAKIAETRKHRGWAKVATLAAMPRVPETGDIAIRFTFIPPDNRSDRTNFANRLKPAIDGIADALAINDRRFLPAYAFEAPDRMNPRVIVEVMAG